MSHLDPARTLRHKLRPPTHCIGRLLTLVVLILISVFATTSCDAQLCATTHATDLYCLIPAAFHTQTAPFNAIFTPFGTELSELPTAKPAGLVLRFEHGSLVPASESLGAVFTERAESLGRHRVFVGLTYQILGFGSVDGQNLKSLPIVLYYAPLSVYTVTQNRFNIRVNQYTALASVGITNRLDVSVAVPFEKVSMGVSVNGNEYGPGGGTANVSEFIPGSSTGIADLVLGAKMHIFEKRGLRLAVGADLRIPTGDELNFLGSGTPGVKPYVAASRRGRFSPHLNVGYQWNGDTILNAGASGGKQQLPTDVFYSAGLNVEATGKWTLTADLLGHHYFDSPRLGAPVQIAVPGFGNAPSVQPFVGSYTANNLGVGVKANTYKHLILNLNATIKLNDGGLRSKIAPLGGISYSF